jgi:hypothetical protein
VDELAGGYRFLHWELEFADVYADRGGFDLVLGNPPWVKVEWSEAGVLGEADPMFVLRKLDAAESALRRSATFERFGNRPQWLGEHGAAAGMQAFLGSTLNFPELAGSQPNLFKNFLPQAWRAARAGGAAGFLHPETVFDEPGGGVLRRAAYSRLRRHYQFQNEEEWAFKGVHHQTRFSANVYSVAKSEPRFVAIANLYAAATVDACHKHLGHGATPGVRTDAGLWETAGHLARIIEVTRAELQLFADVYDDEGTPADQARLPALHARQLIPVLNRFRDGSRSLSAIFPNVHPHEFWHESRAQSAGTIKQSTQYPTIPAEVVLSGPHFNVANPLYKTPRRECAKSSHYDVIDASIIEDDYLPRTNFIRACSPGEYLRRSPSAPWSPPELPNKAMDYFRVIISAMVNPDGERTLQSAIIPPGFAHVDVANSYTLPMGREIAAIAATWHSIPLDFLVKSTGTDKLRPSLAKRLPVLASPRSEILARTLALNCLTTHYAPLWRECWDDAFCADEWTKTDDRLQPDFFGKLTLDWQRNCALRTDYARRQALVEIDVLVSMGLGITLDQLITLYRAQFPVMRSYEKETFYDRNGRIVFTNSRGLVGVGLKRKRAKGDSVPGWDEVSGMITGSIHRPIKDDTLPGGLQDRVIVYEAPWVRCDREADYRQAWAHFGARFGDRR